MNYAFMSDFGWMNIHISDIRGFYSFYRYSPKGSLCNSPPFALY